MLLYQYQAITSKTVNKFTYDWYSAAYANMLKYNNDSSAVLRVLNIFIDVLQKSIEDMNYQVTMTMDGMEFLNIDRLAAYNLSIIPGLLTNEFNGTLAINTLQGYSKYTGNTYTLQQVTIQNDFTRHSFPCDFFLSGEKYTDTSSVFTFPPNTMVPINIDVNDSCVTFRISGGLDITTRQDQTIPCQIIVVGLDLRGQEIREEIDIVDNIDIASHMEYTYIESAMLLNVNAPASIYVFPYITGENVLWQEKFVDREEGDEYFAVISVDYDNKCLNLNKLLDVTYQYPNGFELVRQIPFDFQNDDETINNYFADPPNRIIYVVTSRNTDDNNIEKRLYCFPLTIPMIYCNTIDSNKTQYQSISVEYYEDSVNQLYTFYVFPTSRSNDVELMNITINRISNQTNYLMWIPDTPYDIGQEIAYNGAVFTCLQSHTSSTFFDTTLWAPNTVEYQTDLLLDLIRENIQTNMFQIPFSSLFAGEQNQCIVEFTTFGLQQCVLPIFLYRPILEPFYVKQIDNLLLSWQDYPSPSQGGTPMAITSSYDYPLYNIGGLGYGGEGYGGESSTTVIPARYGGEILESPSDIDLHKLSTIGNILLNGFRVVNVFDTFYYDENSGTVVTSDTISYVNATGSISNIDEDN